MLGSILNDRYEIGQEIGRGAMAIVYLGQDIKLERPVAIKVFNDILSAKALLRAQREAQALARINHPNLVGIRSSEKDEFGRLAIVVDYIDGVALSQLIARQSLDLVTATDLFKQLCAGLGAIHAAHIVHRDIKTSNLMVQTSDKVRRLWLIDFGLAKLDDGSQQKLTSTGTLLGTPAYMSPEQYSGGDITSSSDLYSAACVLYEMLTGKQPFQSETPYLVAHKQLNEQPPPVASHGRPIQNNAAIDSFFLRALNKDPEQRFGSAQEMLHAFLEASRNGVLVKAPKAGKVPFKTVLLFAKIAGTIAIPILAAGVISILVSRSAERKSEAAALSTVRNDVEEFVHSNDHKGARRYLAQEIPELEKIQFNKNDLPQMANIYMVYSKECAADDGTLEDVEKGITATKKALKLFQETPTSSGIVPPAPRCP